MSCTELVSTAYHPVGGKYVVRQLYCPCGGELHGESTRLSPVFSDETWFECQKCGRFITGRDAECLMEAFVNDLL